MERKERGLIGKLLVFVLTLLALIGLVAMALSVANGRVAPKSFIWTSYFGLAFWVIFLFNVLVFMALLALRSRRVWIAVLALAVAVPGIRKSYSLGKQETADSFFRVMSYNVHNFKHIDGKTDSEDFANAIIRLVRENNPDVMCCQEFSAFKKGKSRNQCINLFKQDAGFQYVYYNQKRCFAGNVIFSKYPLSKVDEESGFGQENTYGTMAEVDAGEKGRFYVANVHLLSYNITDSEIDKLMSGSDRGNDMDTIRMTVIRKLKYAVEKRSDQVVSMLDGLPEVDSPVIVCGDFNDPPLSYTYRQMQKAGFSDTFTMVGRGIKPTYAGKLPLLRIDYIWGKEGVKPLDFKRIRYKASDHYPILLDFRIDQ